LAGAPPRTPLGELNALPRDPWLDLGAGLGMGGPKREKGKKKMEGRRRQEKGSAPETAYSR